MKKSPDPIQVFGYRSYIFLFTVILIAALIATWYLGLIGFLIIVITGFYMAHEAIDMMRITMSDELLHVTRYIKLTEYDCKFWLKDIEEAGVYLKKTFGKSRDADGSVHSSGDSWFVLHIILKNGEEQEVKLLGMQWFERAMLKKALADAGIPSFEIGYRYKKDV